MNIFLILLIFFSSVISVFMIGMENVGKREVVLEKKVDVKEMEPFIKNGTDCLKNGELSQLDPLVGETACQIRAVRVADLYDTVQKSNKQLSDSENLLVGAMHALTISRVIFSEENGGYMERIDPKKLGISSATKSKKFIQHGQQLVAQDSVEYLQSKSRSPFFDAETGVEIETALKEVLYTEKPFNRPSMACFVSLYAILGLTQSADRPILFRYGEKSALQITNQQLFVHNTGVQKYVAAKLDDLPPKQSLLVFEGISTATPDMIKQLNPVDVVLKNASIHSQYAGTKNSKIELDYEKLGLKKLGGLHSDYKKQAKNIENLRTEFLIEHVLAGTAKEFTKKQ